MDVHCSTCGEPWDIYHLRHEAIFETDLSQALERLVGEDEDGLAATFEDYNL